MKENLLLVIAIVAVLVSFVNFSTTITKLADVNSAITGMATGYVNLTVNSMLSIEFANGTLDWGPGVVNTTAGCNNATLKTAMRQLTSTCGNWTNASANDRRGLVIENTGNLDVALNITSNKNETDFFGAGNPAYRAFMWNISAMEANSCLNLTGQSGSINLSHWRNVSVTADAHAAAACYRLNYNDVNDTISIDFFISVPVDIATAKYGTLQEATITASAVAL